jgi:hypothetical protein
LVHRWWTKERQWRRWSTRPVEWQRWWTKERQW